MVFLTLYSVGSSISTCIISITSSTGIQVASIRFPFTRWKFAMLVFVSRYFKHWYTLTVVDKCLWFSNFVNVTISLFHHSLFKTNWIKRITIVYAYCYSIRLTNTLRRRVEISTTYWCLTSIANFISFVTAWN